MVVLLYLIVVYPVIVPYKRKQNVWAVVETNLTYKKSYGHAPNKMLNLAVHTVR